MIESKISDNLKDVSKRIRLTSEHCIERGNKLFLQMERIAGDLFSDIQIPEGLFTLKENPPSHEKKENNDKNSITNVTFLLRFLFLFYLVIVSRSRDKFYHVRVPNKKHQPRRDKSTVERI